MKNTSTIHHACMHAFCPSVLPFPFLSLSLPTRPPTHHPFIRLSPIIHSFPRHSLNAYSVDPSGHKMNPRGPLPASRSSHPDGRGVHINKWLIQSARLWDKDLHIRGGAGNSRGSWGKPNNGGDIWTEEVEGYKVNIKINWISIC